MMQDTVFFDTDNLIEGRTAKLTYKGNLANENSAEIYVHFGFGLLWNNLQEVKLTKINDAYEADITLSSCEDINFCFRDENKNWDNNDGANYSAPIKKEDVLIAKADSSAVDVPRLRKSYLIAKKCKIVFYKVITFLPRLFSGELKIKKVKQN